MFNTNTGRAKAEISGQSLSSFELLVCGASAGMSGRLATAPIDRLRILYQVNESRPFTLARGIKTMKVITQTTGIAGLWRGNGAALMRVAPSSAISFMTFDRYHRALENFLGERSGNFGTRFLAGAAAGATAQTFTYPIDLLMARNAAYWNKSPRYISYSSAFVHVARTEGVGGLFRGLAPALMGMLPYAGLNFAIFETSKQKLALYTTDGELTTFQRLFCGGFSGLVAQTATYPIHIIKRRMQVSTESVYQSFRSGFLHVLKTEGLRGGLFKGVLLTWLRGPFAVAIGFTVNDFMKLQFLANKDETIVETQTESLSLVDELITGENASTFQSLIAGACAGATAKTVIAPGDRVKILYQVNPNRAFTLHKAWRSMVTIAKETGVTGLWRGHGATLLRVAPYASLTYVSFERYEGLLATHTSLGETPLSRFLAGALAGATATTLTYPVRLLAPFSSFRLPAFCLPLPVQLDLLRARHASHWGLARPSTSYAHAIQQIARNEGAWALFSGLRPTLLGIVPYAGISFSVFHTLKAKYVKARNLTSEHAIPTVERLAMGGLAGLVAQSATYPLDIVRRRMQVHPPPHSSTLKTMLGIFQREGPRALYKGLSMNWIKGDDVALVMTWHY